MFPITTTTTTNNRLNKYQGVVTEREKCNILVINSHSLIYQKLGYESKVDIKMQTCQQQQNLVIDKIPLH